MGSASVCVCVCVLVPLKSNQECCVLRVSLMYTFGRAYGLPYKMATFIAKTGYSIRSMLDLVSQIIQSLFSILINYFVNVCFAVLFKHRTGYIEVIWPVPVIFYTKSPLSEPFFFFVYKSNRINKFKAYCIMYVQTLLLSTLCKFSCKCV